MNFHKNSLLLYCITGRGRADGKSIYEQIEDALKGGATMLQLREKALSEDAFLKEAKEVKALCQKYHVPLIINDSPDVALKSGADGVHVGISDLPVADIRRQVPKEFIIGATCKTAAQAKAAERAGADYMGVGAVFPSPTKKDAIGITKEELKEICSSVSIPAVAIGGIGPQNIAELKGCGIAGVAVVSAVFSAENITEAARKLKEEAEKII